MFSLNHPIIIISTELEGDEMAMVKDILIFCTGHDEIPPMGLDGGGISIEYLPYGPVLPTASACFNIIRLPMLLSKEEFYTNMNLGILNSNGYYGLS